MLRLGVVEVVFELGEVGVEGLVEGVSDQSHFVLGIREVAGDLGFVGVFFRAHQLLSTNINHCRPKAHRTQTWPQPITLRGSCVYSDNQSVMRPRRNEQTVIKKCEKILAMFEDMFPRPYLVEPCERSLSNHKPQPSRHPTREPLKLTLNHPPSTLKNTNNRSKTRSPSNVSFSSVYSKESRLQKIMKIKTPLLNPKPIPKSKPKPKVKADHNSSFSSVTSNTSMHSNKENKESKNRSNLSRLEKIMKLRVTKPQVNSTLKHYRPQQSAKATPTKKEKSSLLELKECKKQQQRESMQKDREDRLWSTFERERSLKVNEERRESHNKYSQERRVEKNLESLVQKEINRIRADKDRELKKKKIFSDYLF